MPVERVARGDDPVERADHPLHRQHVVPAALLGPVDELHRGARNVVAVGVHVALRAHLEALEHALAGPDVHQPVRFPEDVVHPLDPLARLLDVAHLLEALREPPDERRRHVHVRRERVVVEHDRQADLLADRPVVAEDLVVGRGVVVGRNDHQPVRAERLRLARVAHRTGRVGVHRADQHRDPAGDVPDRRLDEFAPLVIADRQELARGAEDDDPRHAAGELPVEKAPPGRVIDRGAALGERRDGDGVAAGKGLHRSGLLRRRTRPARMVR